MAEKPQGDADRAADADRLRALEAKLAALTPKPEGPGPMGKYEQANLAWRMVIELVVGMVLGLAIGFGLDALFGTRPIFLVVFALLGFAAGVRTMLRTAQEVRGKHGEGALMRDTNDTGPKGPNGE